MTVSKSWRRRMKGFTLIELLVVVAIIALLISILLPSLGKARKQAEAVACASNLKQIMNAMRMYQDEHGGWLPVSYSPGSVYGDGVGSIWSEAAWMVPKRNLWFYQLTPKYLNDPRALICPGDPFRARFDFEARNDTTKAACGYGFNYVLRHYNPYPPVGPMSRMMNPDRFGPRWLAKTILLVDVGPDTEPELDTLMGTSDPGQLGLAWRDGGRLVWNDGVRPWYTSATWLTARHLGKIDMTALDGAVKKVPSIKQLTNRQKLRYNRDPLFGDCYGLALPDRNKYICPLCHWQQSDQYHYSFAESQMWWWTGAFPE
jgi:prepilin-type N-terminal cleavage/methylation domain-containing protein